MASMIQAKSILSTLEAEGHEAYLVGGCVRDLLLNREIHDWDITTSARPEQVMWIFPHHIPTGLAHGTVTVMEYEEPYEVTTFRTEGKYTDSRRPEDVTFVTDLQADLGRRDFTMNAMAMDLGGKITDLFGGEEDIKSKRIVTVGDPVKRFSEDALRMLRAVRFSAQLGFAIDHATVDAIISCSRGCRNLSAERVREEMEKTLLSDHPEKLEDMIAYGLLEKYTANGKKSLHWLGTLPNDKEIRWAGLGVELPDLDFTQLRMDKKQIQLCQCVREHYGDEYSPIHCKWLIAHKGETVAHTLAMLHGKGTVWENILASGDCVHLKDLKLCGGDIHGLKGPAIGAMLWRLLDHVLEHPQDNEKKILDDYLQKWLND